MGNLSQVLSGCLQRVQPTCLYNPVPQPSSQGSLPLRTKNLRNYPANECMKLLKIRAAHNI